MCCTVTVTAPFIRQSDKGLYIVCVFGIHDRYLRQLLFWNLLEMPKPCGTIIPVALGSTLRSLWRSELLTSALISLQLLLLLKLLLFHVCFLIPCFPSGRISGAITSQYLLEKSRIVFQVRQADTKVSIACLFLYMEVLL